MYNDNPDQANSLVETVMNCLKSLFEEYVAADSRNHPGPSQPRSSATIGESSQTNDRRRKLALLIEESCTTEPNKSELEVYLGESNVLGLLDESFDIFAWWKANASKYPTLSRLVRNVLGVPVSTIASESAFSTGGRVLDEYISSLAPETVEALICAQDWIRSSIPQHTKSDGSLVSILECGRFDGEK